MPVVDLLLLGRPYRLTAEPDQEERVRELGDLLNSRLSELKPKARSASDAELMMLAAITLAHDAAEARAALTAARTEEQTQQQGVDADLEAREQALAAREIALNARLAELERLEEELTAPGFSLAEDQPDGSTPAATLPLALPLEEERPPEPERAPEEERVAIGQSVQIPPFQAGEGQETATPLAARERAITLAALDHVTRRLETLASQVEDLGPLDGDAGT